MRRKGKDFDDAVAYWKTLQTDEGATFDTVVTLQAEEISPQVTGHQSVPCDFCERQYSRSGLRLPIRLNARRQKKRWPIWG